MQEVNQLNHSGQIWLLSFLSCENIAKKFLGSQFVQVKIHFQNFSAEKMLTNRLWRDCWSQLQRGQFVQVKSTFKTLARRNCIETDFLRTKFLISYTNKRTNCTRRLSSDLDKWAPKMYFPLWFERFSLCLFQKLLYDGWVLSWLGHFLFRFSGTTLVLFLP